MSDPFVEFAVSTGVTREQAEKLAQTCVTNDQITSITHAYSAINNVDRDINWDSPNGMNAWKILNSLGINADNPANFHPQYWESPARIHGNTMTWSQLYAQTFNDVPTAPDGRLDAGEMIRTHQSNDVHLSQLMGIPNDTNLLNAQGNKAVKGELPTCNPLVSSNEPAGSLGTLTACVPGARREISGDSPPRSTT